MKKLFVIYICLSLSIIGTLTSINIDHSIMIDVNPSRTCILEDNH